MRSPFQPSQWQSYHFACDSNDLEHYQALLSDEISRLNMTATVLGKTGRFPLSLYKSPALDVQLPSILVCAGFHGDEAAGPWGVLKWLMAQDTDQFAGINLSVLPLVCPSGFRKGQQFNRQGQDAFIGYAWQVGQKPLDTELSEEGRILTKHNGLLRALGQDGVLCCSEDISSDTAYLSSYEPSRTPGPFTLQLQAKLGQHFIAHTLAKGQDCSAAGSQFNCFDTGFTAVMVRSGARLGATLFTPGQSAFDARIQATVSLVDTFVGGYLAAG
ncbi:MAG: succinylglutamate desuccinylase/aspartoacylase family protein [Shewanella sp.]|nr:succinylglutamate desuccinylase/aspartoacylase family protein [Shewanella sp.]MCF1431440.1 succinylglutamate desuccinylase/aspartoacylase family protein [Shewanella sp.]MCF1439020.1 succinylglutamate desuccinylase/aspartoacylase family protein [Shewanella sp.]MCF1457374.1 succinylglutamate desuccinylase/aspartoacylase family protein [Shewanella sp.]